MLQQSIYSKEKKNWQLSMLQFAKKLANTTTSERDSRITITCPTAKQAHLYTQSYRNFPRPKVGARERTEKVLSSC
jgi:hypothetical protein